MVVVVGKREYFLSTNENAFVEEDWFPKKKKKLSEYEMIL